MKKEEAIEILSNIVFESADEEIAMKMAIDALMRDDPEVEFKKRFEKTTFCGYTAKELLLFADACKKADVTESDLIDFSRNVESAFNYILEKMQEEMERQLS